MDQISSELQALCDLSPVDGAWTTVLRSFWANMPRNYEALATPATVLDYTKGIGYYQEDFWIGEVYSGYIRKISSFVKKHRDAC